MLIESDVLIHYGLCFFFFIFCTFTPLNIMLHVIYILVCILKYSCFDFVNVLLCVMCYYLLNPLSMLLSISPTFYRMVPLVLSSHQILITSYRFSRVGLAIWACIDWYKSRPPEPQAPDVEEIGSR